MAEIKWYCKHCPANGQFSAPISVQDAYGYMLEEHVKRGKSCPAANTSAEARSYPFIVAALDPNDILCFDGSITRNGLHGQKEITLFLLAVQ